MQKRNGRNKMEDKEEKRRRKETRQNELKEANK